MKIMCFRIFLLMLFPVLPLITCQQRNLLSPCTTFNENSLFVNSTAGNDSATCGARGKPCSSISYAVNRAVDENRSSVVIHISMGSYKESNNMHMDCGRWNLKKIAFWGESLRQGKQVVQVDLSLDVRLCEISLINLQWAKSQPVLHNVLLSNFTLCGSSVQETEFSIIGSSSNIILQSNDVLNSSGYQKQFPLISLTSPPGHQNMLQIVSCNFAKSSGPLIVVTSIHQGSIISSYFEGNRVSSGSNLVTSQFSHLSISNTRFLQNYGTVVGVQTRSLNVSNCHFQQNKVFAGSIFVLEGLSTVGVKDCVFQDSRSSKKGPVMRLVDSYSSAHLERCNFSCNMVSSSTSFPPVMSHDVDQLSFDNCFVDRNCPVHCSPGEFLTSDILCKPCAAGSYSPAVTENTSIKQCASCPAGTYGSKTKTKICTPCAEGTFSSKAGSTLCSKCKNDFFTSAPGQASCSKVTTMFIILIALASFFTFVPLLLLFLQSRQSSQKKKNDSPVVSSDDTSPLFEEKYRPNFSIQNGCYSRAGLPDLPA